MDRTNTKKEDIHMKYLENLAKLAEDMTPVNSFRVAACIVYRNDVISYGFCSKKTHPFQKKFSKNELAISIHAENAAIVNALKKIEAKDFKKTTLYVARVKKEKPHSNKFVFGLAKPCPGCMKAITAFGIKQVYFTCDNDGYDHL